MPAVSEGGWEEKAFMLSTVFKPATPINRRDLFAGRQSQIRDVVDAINQQGQHAVLYGERGVGKTSLANMILPNLKTEAVPVVVTQINCMSSDTYSGIWRRVFEEIIFNAEKTGTLGDSLGKGVKRLMKDYVGSYADEVSPDIVRRVLHTLGQDHLVVIALDEFDTVGNPETRSTISNTLKFLSDRTVPATVVLIGVSDDVESLIADHRSLERCLRQIPMPRMSDGELESIVRKGLEHVGMTIESRGLDEIARLSRGLPHYSHLLGLHAGRAAVDSKTLVVNESHVQSAIETAIEKAQASIQGDYSKAITSSRRDALYKEVLLACALAETDDLGWFYPRDVRAPLERILKREYKIEAFARHLHAFGEKERGPILINDNRSARPRYHFENPLMQPYVLMRGRAQGLIRADDILDGLERLQGKIQRELF
jgi:Cdc6-like AAA superfamily ATPase